MENYGGGLLAINIDVVNYELYKNKQLINDYKLCEVIKEQQWKNLMQESEKIVKKHLKKSYKKNGNIIDNLFLMNNNI